MQQSRISVIFLLLQSVFWCNVLGYNPKPNPKSVVEVGGDARFTVLTERLIRMEWGGTNDAASFTFINRDLPTPTYDVSSDGPATLIRTPFLTVYYLCLWLLCRKTSSTLCLKVRYKPNNQSFTAANLQVSLAVDGETITWAPVPGVDSSLAGNLLGTVRVKTFATCTQKYNMRLCADPRWSGRVGKPGLLHSRERRPPLSAGVNLSSSSTVSVDNVRLSQSHLH